MVIFLLIIFLLYKRAFRVDTNEKCGIKYEIKTEINNCSKKEIYKLIIINNKLDDEKK